MRTRAAGARTRPPSAARPPSRYSAPARGPAADAAAERSASPPRRSRAARSPARQRRCGASRALDFLELVGIELDRIVDDAIARPAEVAYEGEVDLAADHAQHAVELVGGKLQPAAQRLERGLHQQLLRLLEPAKRGHAMNAI